MDKITCKKCGNTELDKMDYSLYMGINFDFNCMVCGNYNDENFLFSSNEKGL